MKTIGANNYKETVHVWAEKKRIPNSNESLGGISGGPILNKDGKVVGIHVAGSLRRGRSFSSLPSNINDLLNKYNINIKKFQECHFFAENTLWDAPQHCQGLRIKPKPSDRVKM